MKTIFMLPRQHIIKGLFQDVIESVWERANP